MLASGIPQARKHNIIFQSALFIIKLAQFSGRQGRFVGAVPGFDAQYDGGEVVHVQIFGRTVF
ncbi:MAG TPA: hypothetical protein VFG03_21120, partial [Telluria sp.]|nr:hypothetical protein [Telluria sp.]